MREGLRKDCIAVTLVNPGTFGTLRHTGDDLAVEPVDGYAGTIAPADLLATFRFVSATSNATCVREIDVVAMEDPL